MAKMHPVIRRTMAATRAPWAMRALVILFVLAVPAVAPAQTQLRLLQQEQMWHLQQQERQGIAQQQEKRQMELLQQNDELRRMAVKPLPERLQMRSILKSQAVIAGCIGKKGSVGPCRSLGKR